MNKVSGGVQTVLPSVRPNEVTICMSAKRWDLQKREYPLASIVAMRHLCRSSDSKDKRRGSAFGYGRVPERAEKGVQRRFEFASEARVGLLMHLP